MSILQRLSKLETEKAAEEFGRLVRFILRHRGDFSEAVRAAQTGQLGNMRGLSMRSADVLRSYGGGLKISQKSITTPNMLAGGALADYSALSQGFIASLVNASAFDTMLASMVPVPLGTGTVGAVSTGVQAFSVGEAGMKPIGRLSISSQQMTPQKAGSIIVVSNELARTDISNAVALINRQLRLGVAQATDQQFITSITTGVSIPNSFGPTAEAVRADISNLLARITTGSDSLLFIVTTPLIVKTWSMLTDQKGVSAFEDLTPTGGEINGIRVIPSDGVSAGTVVLADASGIAAAAGEVMLEQFKEGLFQFDSAPDSPPTASTNLTALWQNNLVAVRTERYFCAVKLRSDAVAACINGNSYQSGNSPP